MPVKIIYLLEIVNVDHQKHGVFPGHQCTQRVVCLGFHGPFVIQPRQGVALCTLPHALGLPLFRVDVQNHAHRFGRFTRAVFLQRRTHTAPQIAPVPLLNAKFRLLIGFSFQNIRHLAPQQWYIIRMQMRVVQQVRMNIFPHRLIAKFLFPVGRESQCILFDLPLKNNVVGLIHNDLVAFQRKAQILLRLFCFSNIQQNAVEYLSPILPAHELASVLHPNQTTILAGHPVLNELRIAFFQLRMHSLPCRCNIRLVNHLGESVMENSPQLLACITQH